MKSTVLFFLPFLNLWGLSNSWFWPHSKNCISTIPFLKSLSNSWISDTKTKIESPKCRKMKKLISDIVVFPSLSLSTFRFWCAKKIASHVKEEGRRYWHAGIIVRCLHPIVVIASPALSIEWNPNITNLRHGCHCASDQAWMRTIIQCGTDNPSL